MENNTAANIRMASDFRDRAKALVPAPPAHRERLLASAAFCDLAFELHEAIILLFERELYGSALALGRTLFGTCVRSRWLLYCGPEHGAFQLLKEQETNPSKRPHFGSMLNDLAKTQGSFSKENRTISWDQMHTYTHSGGIQVVHRLQRGQIQPNYQPTLVHARILAATSDLLDLTLHACRYDEEPGHQLLATTRCHTMIEELGQAIEEFMSANNFSHLLADPSEE
jgi:hypothetical protein